jgi:signal transduction histidine kinase/CRP-like cAMP-binding protein
MKKKNRTRKSRRHTIHRPAPHSPARVLVENVKKNILFTNVPRKTLTTIAPKLVQRRFKPGKVIFNELTRGRSLYLILQGRVRIKKYTKYGIESLLAVLHPGDFFGELSIIDGLPRSARAEALDDCTIVEFSSTDFRSLIKESDAFTFNLLKNLALRLRTIDQTFVLELERNALSSKIELEKLNMLISASKTVNSTLDINKLLGLILETATRATKADRGTVYLRDETNNQIWSEVAQGENMLDIRLPIGKGLAGYVAKTGLIVNIADVYKDSRFDPEIDRYSGYKTRTMLCMPMRDKEGQIVGVIQLLNKFHGSFTPDDESFIDALSVHAALAVENVRMAREMVRSERLSAVGRMASTIIHDIKNPMATLHTYAQIIKRKSESAEAADIADQMIRQVDRFVKMTQEVLDFSRGISEMTIERVNLGSVLEGALKFIKADFTKGNIALVQNFEYSGECSLDVEKIHRAVYNIASNAVDAMPDGGSLTVHTRKVDDRVEIEFTDTGKGIPDEVKPRVLEPFFTFGKKHGTGLGLAIVKKIVEDHHGTIAITSKPGQGTTICLSLPLTM